MLKNSDPTTRSFNTKTTLAAAILLACLALGGLFAAEENGRKPSISSDLEANILTWGVVRDGKQDDTAALQAMIDSGIGNIHLPRGTYRITRPLVIDLEKVGFTSLSGDGTPRIVMDGPGPAIKFVGTHQGTAAPNTVKPNVWDRQRMPMVDGVEIVGAHEEADGIEAVRTMQLTLTRVAIRSARHAVHLTERNRNVVISSCHFYENHGIGVFLDDVDLHQINISSSHISYNQGGVVSREGNVRNIQISGCDIEANVQNVLIDSGSSKSGTAEVAITGCTLQHSGGPNSANVRFIGATPDGERCWGMVTIANNVMSDVETNIHIQKARDVIVTGNTIFSGYQYSLLVEDSSNVVIGPNVVTRNERYRDRETSQNGILIRNCDGGTISGLHVSEVLRAEAGMILDRCRRFHVTGCTILDCDHAAILLHDVQESRVTGSLLRGNSTDGKPWKPILVEGGKDNVIEL